MVVVGDDGGDGGPDDSRYGAVIITRIEVQWTPIQRS